MSPVFPITQPSGACVAGRRVGRRGLQSSLSHYATARRLCCRRGFVSLRGLNGQETAKPVQDAARAGRGPDG
jgi:hypothetical protein